jgi:predicted  nucleic acid-binding Zn-ribbon protein
MTILEVLLLLALIVGAVYHWVVRLGLGERISDLEFELGNVKFASSRQSSAYGQLIAESKQLEHDLEQYKTAACKWEDGFNDRMSEVGRVTKEVFTLREHIVKLEEQIKQAKAALR